MYNNGMTTQHNTKTQVNGTVSVLQARVNARLDDFKKNDPMTWWGLSEREYLELLHKFYKEESLKYIAEATA
jgi:hypothetical protein